MAIEIDLTEYIGKIDACRALIAEKRAMLASTRDSLVSQTLERNICNLIDLLSTYEKILKTLGQIQRIDARSCMLELDRPPPVRRKSVT